MTASGLPTAAMIVDTLTGPPEPHGKPGRDDPLPGIMEAILALHRNNVEQWDREDEARGRRRRRHGGGRQTSD